MPSNARPTAVVFDLGKVLLDFDYLIAASKFESRCEITTGKLQQLLEQSPLLGQFETNQISVHDFYIEVKKLSGFRGDAAEFKEIFGDIFCPILPMIELHAELRSRSIPTYLFSNTNFLATEFISARFPFYFQFEGRILSCEHGCMKPDPRIYVVVEQVSGRSGAELLYIDDRLENVSAARDRGWRAIHHLSAESTVPLVRECLGFTHCPSPSNGFS